MTPTDGQTPADPDRDTARDSGGAHRSPVSRRRAFSAIPHGGGPSFAAHDDPSPGPTMPRDAMHSRVAAIIASGFALDGVHVSPRDVGLALGRRFRRGRVSSPQERRIRTHAAVLLGIERAIRKLEPLRTDAVLRWYTRLNGGLSLTAVPDNVVGRLAGIVERINAPSHDRRRVLRDASSLYANLLADPLFSGFNRSLARLLLRYQLGRSAIVIPLPDPPDDPAGRYDEPALAAYLLRQMEQALTPLPRQRPRPT